MANTIKLKRGTSTPSTSDISSGEVAIDTSAQKLYINDSGTVKEIGGSGSSIGGNTGVDFNDNVKARWGTGNDLEIYHDGSHSYIADVGVGNLYIQSNHVNIDTDNGEQLLNCIKDGAVELYYDNVVKLQTQSWGVLINDQLKLTDSKSLFIGDGNDFQIYHDGSNTHIENATGVLNLRNSSNIVLAKAHAETLAVFTPDGANELYYDNSKKLETSSTGVDITGHVKLGDNSRVYFGDGDDMWIGWNGSDGEVSLASGALYMHDDIIFYDDKKAKFGSGTDLQIYHDGSNSWLKDTGTGNLNVASSAFAVKNAAADENMLATAENGNVELFYDNSKKLETHTNGVTITGTLSATAFSGAGSGLTGISNLASDCVGAAQIQDNVVREEKLQVSNAPTNGYVLTARSGNTGGMTWEAVSASDSTKLPLAGGTMTGNLLLGDDIEARFGASADLKLWHGSGHSWIKNITGSLYVAADAFRVSYADMTGTMITADNGGKVALYYDNSKKFETTSTGAKVKYALQIEEESGSEYYQFVTNSYGGLEVQNETTKVCEFTDASTLDFPDNNKIQLGTGSDLKIYHNGSASYIQSPSHTLYIQSTTIDIGNGAANEPKAKFHDDGAVELYYDSSKKFETTSDGATFSGSALFPDNQRIKVGGDASNPDLQIWHDGTNSHVNNSTGYLVVGTDSYAVKDQTLNEFYIKALKDGAVELYYDNAKRLETTSSGITIPNTLTVSDGANIDGDIKFKGSGDGDDFFWDKSADQLTLTDSRKIRFGDSGDLEIYHDGSDSYIKDAGTGILVLQTNYLRVNNAAGNETIINAAENGSVDLYYDNSKKFETTSAGGTLTGALTVTNEINLFNGTTNASRYIDAGLGDSNALVLRGCSGGDANHETLAQFIRGGAVELYSNNTKVFQTTTNGVQVLGTEGNDANLYIFPDEADDLADQWRIRGSHASQNLRIESRNSSGTYEQNISCYGDGAVELYYDNALKFATTSDGVNVSDESGAVHLRLYTGTSTLRGYLYADDSNRIHLLDAQGHKVCMGQKDGAFNIYYDNTHVLETSSTGIDLAASKDLKVQTTGKVKFGAGNADIKHTGTHFYFKSNTGDCYWDSTSAHYFRTNDNENAVYCASNAHVSLYYDNSQKFYTQSYGCVVAGDLKPESNNTYNLGDSSYRWANLYVNDMHFSNEGKSNSVDGTWGDWTLQEGDENIFMINNRTGKKYKMGLQEVN